jgi:Ser/Thr protein kinase RdoA (MazF antagonist)
LLNETGHGKVYPPTLGKIGSFCFAVWEKVRGRVPLELEEQDVLSIGRTIARMHNLFERRINPEFFLRTQFSLEMYLTQPLQNLMSWNQMPKQFEQPIFQLIEQLFRGLSWLPHADHFLPVHADLHRLNLVQTSEGGQFWFVDFDDCQLGLAMQDLWPLASTCGVSLPNHMKDVEGANPSSYALELLTQGYSEFRALPQDWKIFVEPLRTLKMVHYLGWIAGRWSDPFFKQTFSFFDDRQYWEKTYFELSDQFQILAQGGLLEL